MAQSSTDTLEQYGEDDEDDVYDPNPSSYRPSLSTGVYGSYVLLEPPTCPVCQYPIAEQQRVSLSCCGVELHGKCFADVLKDKQVKPGQRLTLCKLGCIHCRDQMKCSVHEYDALLSTVNAAYIRFVKAAMERIEEDRMAEAEILMEEKQNAEPEHNPWDIDVYEFRSCYHCRKPFCVGKNGCGSNVETQMKLFDDVVDMDKIETYCCSKDCIFAVGKSMYKERGAPLIRDASNVLSDIKQNASNYKNVALPLHLGQDKPFDEWNERQFKEEFSQKFNIPIECIKILSVKAGSVMIDMKIETHKNGKQLLLPIECIADRISTKKAQKAFVEFSIFAIEFGEVTAGFKLLQQRVVMNPKWNRAYGKATGATDWDGPLNDGKSRGGEPYYCPKGWKRFAIQFDVTPYDFDNVYDNWPIAYHGTKFDFGMMIAMSGLKCSRAGAPYGVHGEGVYLSPSIKYVSHPRYCKPIQLDLSKAKGKSWKQDQINAFKKYDKKWIQCAFMCRVKPGSYRKCCETMGLGKDGKFDNIDKKEIEWIIDGKAGDIIEDDKILIYGIMIRACSKKPVRSKYYNEYETYHSDYRPPQNDGGCIMM